MLSSLSFITGPASVNATTREGSTQAALTDSARSSAVRNCCHQARPARARLPDTGSAASLPMKGQFLVSSLRISIILLPLGTRLWPYHDTAVAAMLDVCLP